MDLNISEHFHSIQGEGSTAGSQAVFLRLKACNLLCGGTMTRQDGELHNGAKWRCDTIETWIEGDSHSIQGAYDLIYRNYGQMLANGSHLIITGGEPLLQQEALKEFLFTWSKFSDIKIPFIEVETNGTIEPDPEFAMMVDLWNVSPKLSNSGMPKKRRIKPDALLKYAEFTRENTAIFKFVIFDQDDIIEANEMINGFGVKKDQVYLMPACSNMEQWNEAKQRVVELCKEFGYNFSPRLQIAIYNQTVGV